MEFHHVGIDLTPCLPYKFRRDGFHASRCVLLIVGTKNGIGGKEDTNMKQVLQIDNGAVRVFRAKDLGAERPVLYHDLTQSGVDAMVLAALSKKTQAQADITVAAQAALANRGPGA